MSRKMNVVLQEKSSYALREQVKIGQYDLPFTINPTIGCLFGIIQIDGYDPSRPKK